MGNSLPFSYVPLLCLKCGNYFYKKKKKELSEYKAIGMIQDHLSLLYQAMQKDTKEITKVLIRLFTLLQKKWTEISSIREKRQSLILWVLSMSIMD